MLKVTLSDYTVVYASTMGEALEKAFKLGKNIRFIEWGIYIWKIQYHFAAVSILLLL